MKKLLGIVVLGLLWCTSANAGYADVLIKIPVHVHILDINEKSYKTITTTEHVKAHFKKANKIWSQANIFFDVIKINTIPANTNNFKKNTKWLRANSYVKKKKQTTKMILHRYKIRDELLQVELHQKKGVFNVYYIPYLFSGLCGVTQRWSKPLPDIEYLVMAQEIDPKLRIRLPCPKGLMLAHELGHMVYLLHDQKKNNLMNVDVAGYKGEKIPKKEIIKARENYKKYLEEYLEQ